MDRTLAFAPYVVTTMLIVVGVIHLLPLMGALGGDRLSALYGIRIDEPNLEILMRHRAVLFGLLGAFLLFAAFKPPYQNLALLAGFLSVITFLFFAGSAEHFNAAIRRVVIADWIALAALIVAAVAHVLSRSQANA
jgi:hypothetical protein